MRRPVWTVLAPPSIVMPKSTEQPVERRRPKLTLDKRRPNPLMPIWSTPTPAVVASVILSCASIASRLRGALGRRPNTELLLDPATALPRHNCGRQTGPRSGAATRFVAERKAQGLAGRSAAGIGCPAGAHLGGSCAQPGQRERGRDHGRRAAAAKADLVVPLGAAVPPHPAQKDCSATKPPLSAHPEAVTAHSPPLRKSSYVQKRITIRQPFEEAVMSLRVATPRGLIRFWLERDTSTGSSNYFAKCGKSEWLSARTPPTWAAACHSCTACPPSTRRTCCRRRRSTSGPGLAAQPSVASAHVVAKERARTTLRPITCCAYIDRNEKMHMPKAKPLRAPPGFHELNS